MVVGVVTGCGIGLTNKNLLAPGLQVSVMLNIRFTLSGGGGLAHNIWHMTESRCIHSQELLLLALLLVLLATGTINDLYTRIELSL